MRNLNWAQTLILMCLSLCMWSQAQGKQMNVLILNVDDLKPNLGCYGDDFARTPNIDKLGEQGTVFLANYCQQAVCAASRVSMYTGVRPDSTGVLDLHTHMRDINPNIITLPEFYKSKGYESIGFGKILHGAKNDDPQSWSKRVKDSDLPYASSHRPPVMGKFQSEECHQVFKQIKEQHKGKYIKTSLIQKKLKAANQYPATEAFDLPDEAYPDGAIAKAGIEALKNYAETGKAFCMVLGFRKPHLPFNAPKKYWDMYERSALPISTYQKMPKDAPKYSGHTYGELGAYSGYSTGVKVEEDQQRDLIHGYYACASYIDAQIGKVMKALETTGLDKNTVVVLWGDHGWHLGDHGIWCKHSNFEQATAAPLIISAPGMARNQKTKSHSEFVDIFPTVCELTGMEIPEQVEGDSLVPVLKDGSASVKEFSMSQYPRGNIMGYSLRSGRYRLVYWMKNYHSFSEFSENKLVASELYDYLKDPLETVNFAMNPEYASVLSLMDGHMKSHFTKYYNAEKAATMPALIKSKSRKKKK